MNIISKSVLAVGVLCLSLNLTACGSSKNKDAMSANTGVQTGTSYDDNLSGGAYQDQPVVDGAAGGLRSVFYFGFDQDSLTAEAQSDLNAHAERLRGGSDSIRLEGHADEQGSREYNMALSERRAKAVANYLSAQGVSGSRFDIVAYGEEKPAADGSSERSHALNRRVELK